MVVSDDFGIERGSTVVVESIKSSREEEWVAADRSGSIAIQLQSRGSHRTSRRSGGEREIGVLGVETKRESNCNSWGYGGSRDAGRLRHGFDCNTG